jgi:hypothetical protein
MHVRVAILVTLLAVLPAPAAHADFSAGVRMLECQPADGESEGAVVYRARMHAAPDSARMALRIRLFAKYGDGEYERVEGEDLGVWHRSRAGVTAFRWSHAVDGLHDGATYRAVVHYRWLDSDGDVIHTTRRRSETCVQGGGLPNLRVKKVDVRPGEVAGTAIYKVKVVNRGVVAAQNVAVLLRVDGEIVDEKVLEVLPASETKSLRFNGPRCHDNMRVVVDPKDLISESREQDNARDPRCL